MDELFPQQSVKKEEEKVTKPTTEEDKEVDRVKDQIKKLHKETLVIIKKIKIRQRQTQTLETKYKFHSLKFDIFQDFKSEESVKRKKEENSISKVRNFNTEEDEP